MSTPNNPKVYRTVTEIAQRLGVHPNAVLSLRLNFGLPMYKNDSRRGEWFTTEEAVLDWQWYRARLDREFWKLERAWSEEPLNARSAYGRQRYLNIMKRYRKLTVEQVGQAEVE